jgi:hypothetical protein
MTVLNTLLPLPAAIVSFVFAVLVLDQWLRRRRIFQLVWGLGLVWFGIGSGTEFLGAALGWNAGLYRAWYLFGGILVAAYLGAGTVALLSRTGFGYFAGVSIAAGGLFAYLTQLRLVQEGHPAAWADVFRVMDIAGLAGVAVIVATAWRRELAAPVGLAVLAGASLVAAALVVTAAVPAPGYALDPVTHVPVGTAMPGHLRVLAGPFNVAGALCLVFGALFSAYVYMPKRKLLHGHVTAPVASQLYRALAVMVNLVASVPLAVRSLLAGRLSSRVSATVLIALGGFVLSGTSGPSRFGLTWLFALGQLLGILLIFGGFLVSEEVFRDVRLGFLRLPLGRTPAARPD